MENQHVSNRDLVNLIIITITSILFTLFSISTQFLEGTYSLLYSFVSLSTVKFLSRFIFLYLIGLLWLTFRRWKKAEKRQNELEDVISSINQDILMVVDANRNITMCNNSIERVFGYKANEVINKKADILYFDSQAHPKLWHEIYEILEKEGFHIGLATGRKKNGDIIPLEIITGSLSGHGGAVLLLRDITERKKAEETIKHAYAELDQIFNTAADGMLVVDKAFNVLRVNDTFLTLLGVDKNEVSGKKCHEISHCSQYLTPHCPLSRMQDGEGKFEHEIKIERYDGTKIPCILTVTAFKDSHGELIGIIEDLRDITERKLMEEKLHTLSLIDELTGLYNRRGFLTLTEQQTKLAQRIKKGLLLLFIDLDRMKWINDNLGHNEGDRALKGIAAVLKNTFRPSDVVARIGGDEFAITAIEAQKESVEVIVDRLQKNLELQNIKEHRGYTITISIGSVYFDPEHPSSIDELLSKADAAMYENKRGKQRR